MRRKQREAVYRLAEEYACKSEDAAVLAALTIGNREQHESERMNRMRARLAASQAQAALLRALKL